MHVRQQNNESEEHWSVIKMVNSLVHKHNIIMLDVLPPTLGQLEISSSHLVIFLNNWGAIISGFV